MHKIMQGSLAAAIVCGLTVGQALAAPITDGTPIEVDGKKLIIVDKITAASKAKVVYVCKDKAAGITKGAGLDATLISAAFAYQSATLGSEGRVDMPQGASWLVNKEKVAKYVNKAAPDGGAVKVAVIKPGKLLKAVAKDLGDAATKIDIYQGGATDDTATVATQYYINNDGEEFNHCGLFDCKRKIIGGGSGAKLVCKTPQNVPCPGASPSGAFID